MYSHLHSKDSLFLFIVSLAADHYALRSGPPKQNSPPRTAAYVEYPPPPFLLILRFPRSVNLFSRFNGTRDPPFHNSLASEFLFLELKVIVSAIKPLRHAFRFPQNSLTPLPLLLLMDATATFRDPQLACVCFPRASRPFPLQSDASFHPNYAFRSRFPLHFFLVYFVFFLRPSERSAWPDNPLFGQFEHFHKVTPSRGRSFPPFFPQKKFLPPTRSLEEVFPEVICRRGRPFFPGRPHSFLPRSGRPSCYSPSLRRSFPRYLRAFGYTNLSGFAKMDPLSWLQFLRLRQIPLRQALFPFLGVIRRISFTRLLCVFPPIS